MPIRNTEEAVEKLVNDGKVEFIEKLRGKDLCCNDPANIIIEPMALPSGFDLKRAEHFENFKKEKKKAHCKYCGAKYWVTDGREVLLFRE